LHAPASKDVSEGVILVIPFPQFHVKKIHRQYFISASTDFLLLIFLNFKPSKKIWCKVQTSVCKNLDVGGKGWPKGLAKYLLGWGDRKQTAVVELSTHYATDMC